MPDESLTFRNSIRQIRDGQNVEAANALQSAANQLGGVQSITTSHVPSGSQNMNGIFSAFVSVCEASQNMLSVSRRSHQTWEINHGVKLEPCRRTHLRLESGQYISFIHTHREAFQHFRTRQLSNPTVETR